MSVLKQIYTVTVVRNDCEQFLCVLNTASELRDSGSLVNPYPSLVGRYSRSVTKLFAFTHVVLCRGMLRQRVISATYFISSSMMYFRLHTEYWWHRSPIHLSNVCVFQRVLLRFNRFKLEYGSSSCPYDRVKIFDGSSGQSTLKGTYCGTNVPSNFLSSSNVAFVSFTSDLSVVLPGFNIHYSMGEYG